MSFDVAAVRKVLDAFENSRCREISLRSGDCELVISVDGDQVPEAAAAVEERRRSVDLSDNLVTEPVVVDNSVAAHNPSIADNTSVPGSEAAVLGNTVDVVSPTVGIFWRSPQPGAPPFVEVGDVVEADATTCIVEVMKLMNHVKAGAAGRVVAVHAANAEQVSTGQALFTVEVAG